MGEASGTIARPRELAIVCAAGLALTLLLTWPLGADLAHLGRTLPTDADGQFSIWNIAWVARTLFADPMRLFDANIFHPHKLTLAYSEANVLPGALGAPVWWISRNPWLTLNVVFLFGFASAYVCAYLLFRELTGSRSASAVGAILYAFCPYVFSHLSHIQLLMTGGIPLSMLMLHRLVDNVRPVENFRLKAKATSPVLGSADSPPPNESSVASALKTRRDPNPLPVASAFRRQILDRRKVSDGVYLGLALAAQALSCAYYGIFAGLMVGYGALLLAFTRRLWRSTSYWIAVAIGAATSIVLVAPFFVPFLMVQSESGFARTVADTAKWAARPHGYLVSSANAHRWLLEYARQFGPWEEVLFPGLLAVLLGAAGLVIAIRRNGRDRETSLLYGTLGLLAFWASFGPAAGLYRVLFYLPTFSFLRAPSRLGLVVVLCLALFATFALKALIELAGTRWRSLVTAIAIAAAIGDLGIYPLKWFRAPEVPAGYAVLASQPRAPLAEFPFYGERIAFPLHAQYMLFSTAHWMPMVNGYSDVIPLDFREAAPILDSFPSDAAFATLARRRVRYIAVHWDMFAGRGNEIRDRLARYLPNLRALHEDDRMSVFEVVKYP